MRYENIIQNVVKIKLNKILHCVFKMSFQVRQSWYILAGSISKVVTFLVKNDVMSQKHLDKLINNLMGKLDDSDASILSNIWDSALLLSFNYPVSFFFLDFFLFLSLTNAIYVIFLGLASTHRH